MDNQPRQKTHPSERDRADEQNPKRQGDVLGISDADPAVEIPRATTDRGGNPAGIEIGPVSSPMGGLKRSKGATGIDMGSGGTGTDVEPARTSRPDPTE
jgi:hypothetical protein